MVHWSSTVPPAATVAEIAPGVAFLWQMMSALVYSVGSTNPKSVAVVAHPITAGGLDS